MTSISKPLIRSPDTSLLSPSSLLYFIKPSQQCLCIPSKPISFQPLSSKFKIPYIVTYVAQRSDWTQQEEDEMNTMPLIESGNEELDGTTWENQSKTQASNWAGEEREEDGFVEPPEEAKIYVGNLPYEVDGQRLAMLFEKAGTVEIAEVIYNRDTDTSRGFGFVTMSTVEEAEKAVELFNRYEVEGRLLTVTKAAPKGSRPERMPRGDSPGFKLYVGNIPWDIDNNRLEQLFSEYGKVVEARVVFDRESGRSRGFGFVTMGTKIEMDDAIAALDGQNLEGRTVRVNVAEDKPRRRF